MKNNHIEIFTNVYENCIWGTNNDKNYKGGSGGGSALDYNIKTYIPFIKNFIINKNIKTVIDLGCGDFRCGNYIYDGLDIKYYGYDAYDKIIKNNNNKFSKEKYNFIHLDFLNNKEEIVKGDLCILKDVLQHWRICEIYEFLDYLTESKKFKYILICNCCYQKEDNPPDSQNIKIIIPLSIDYYPLKKYNPIKLLNYNTKEISLIQNLIEN
jgi:hypothetical protein